MVKNLDQVARRIDMVTIFGLCGIPLDRTALEYGSDKELYTQAKIDESQEQYQYLRVREAIYLVTTFGLNGIPVEIER